MIGALIHEVHVWWRRCKVILENISLKLHLQDKQRVKFYWQMLEMLDTCSLSTADIWTASTETSLCTWKLPDYVSVRPKYTYLTLSFYCHVDHMYDKCSNDNMSTWNVNIFIKVHSWCKNFFCGMRYIRNSPVALLILKSFDQIFSSYRSWM